jgi:hypothetical protein
MLTDKEMHDRMVNGWRAGRPFTVCGNGSLPDATANIRAWLPEACRRHGIRTVCDAGAGDLQWKEGMRWDVEYRPFDLIPRSPVVSPLDITRDALPSCDAILCRMVLNHLDGERVTAALGLFASSARFLFATQFNGEDLPQRSPQFTRLDLRQWLGDPIESVRDGREGACRLALWDLTKGVMNVG